MPEAPHTHGAAGGRATLGRDDRSGLLDIHALSSVIDAQRRAEGSACASSLALPSFGSAWALGEVAPTPAAPVRSVPPVRVATTTAAPDNRPLYAMIVVLSIAVLSLGVFVALRQPTTVVAASSAGPDAPKIESVAAADDKHGAEPIAVAAITDDVAGEEPSVVNPLATEVATVEPKTEPFDEAVTRRNRGKRPRRPTRPKASTPTTPKPQSSGAVPVACVIDPASCDRPAKPPTITPAAKQGPLPAMPNSTQVRTAMAEFKPRAKACGRTHGIAAGEKVRIKFSVVGSTGAVKSAKAVDEYASTPVGRCVAQAVGGAVLPRFAKPQAGITFAFRM